MQIYMKDGKALKINGGYLSPKASGETWVLNEQCYNFQSDASGNGFITNFISNNTRFTSTSIKGGFHNPYLYYDNTPVASASLAPDGHDITDWTNQAYRTITFLEPPTGNLLMWLQANGTKQQHQHIGGKD